MAFKKGERHPNQGGRVPGNGRKSNVEKELQKLVKARIIKKLNAVVDKLIESYLQLAKGRMVKHYNQQTGQHIYTEFEVDAATIRHAISLFVPAARQEIDLTGGAERITNITNTFDANAKWRELRESKKNAGGN
jgi:hypothetical protein